MRRRNRFPLLFLLGLAFVPQVARASLPAPVPTAPKAPPPAHVVAPTPARAPATKVPTTVVRDQARTLRASTPGLESILRAQAADPHIGKVLEHSKQNGNYYVVSDLHMGLGRTRQAGGAFDPQEDFTRPEVFVKTLHYMSHRPGNNTLVVGGDFLDVLEHVAPEESLDAVRGAVTKMVQGHATEFKALASAVVKDNLHVVYLRGNHDIRLLDASELVAKKTTVRDHFLAEIGKVAGLSEADTKVFRDRVGFAGHMAPLGKFGEMLVFHGEQTDPTNSWRSPQNPYSYTKDGKRVIERNVGDSVVQDVYRAVEVKDPDADNRAESSTRAVAHDLVRSGALAPRAMKLYLDVSRHRVTTSDGQELAERIDDRHVLKQWVDQTGFAGMMNQPLREGEAPRNLTSAQIARSLDHIYQETSMPLHEEMTSSSHVMNATVLALGKGRRTLDAAAQNEPKMLGGLTQELPNVRYVVWGHDHKERARTGQMADRGQVGFFDSGTWTKTNGEDLLEVVEAHTDATGRIQDDVRALRVDPSTGAPAFVPRAFEEKNRVPGWGK